MSLMGLHRKEGVGKAQPRKGRRLRFFVPILAGATWGDRMIACLGALIAIAATALLCAVLAGPGSAFPFLVASMGASAVLLFAIPTSPLAQPWPIIGGNVLSTVVGIATAQMVGDPFLACGLAVALAIGLMSLARCLHPPGGAAALAGALGGADIAAAGLLFALAPVGLNAVLLTLVGYAFHRLSGRTYPHQPAALAFDPQAPGNQSPQVRVGFSSQDIDDALRDLGETFDIDRNDLDRLLRQVEIRTASRAHSKLRCADIMSRNIVRAQPYSLLETPRKLLLDHNIRVLPVVDRADRVLGCVGLRELARRGRSVGEVMSPAWTASADTPAAELIEPLSSGRHHAAVIVDDRNRLLGLVTQTDLLAMLGRLPVTQQPG